MAFTTSFRVSLLTKTVVIPQNVCNEHNIYQIRTKYTDSNEILNVPAL
jgi:hypothetical protein